MNSHLHNQIIELNNELSVEQQREKFKKAFKTTKDILKASHNLTKAQVECYPVSKAIDSSDKDTMIMILSKYLNKYRNFINNTSFITNRKVIDVPIEFFEDKTIDYMIEQLEFVRFAIYAKTAGEFGLEKVIEKALMKIFNIK